MSLIVQILIIFSFLIPCIKSEKMIIVNYVQYQKVLGYCLSNFNNQ